MSRMIIGVLYMSYTNQEATDEGLAAREQERKELVKLAKKELEAKYQVKISLNYDRKCGCDCGCCPGYIITVEKTEALKFSSGHDKRKWGDEFWFSKDGLLVKKDYYINLAK